MGVFRGVAAVVFDTAIWFARWAFWAAAAAVLGIVAVYAVAGLADGTLADDATGSAFCAVGAALIGTAAAYCAWRALKIFLGLDEVL